VQGGEKNVVFVSKGTESLRIGTQPS